MNIMRAALLHSKQFNNRSRQVSIATTRHAGSQIKEWLVPTEFAIIVTDSNTSPLVPIV